MTIDEVLEKAKEGNADAMVLLGDACTANEIMDYNNIMNALSWYEYAAKAGSSEGAMRAVSLYKILAMINEENSEYRDAIDDYGKAIKLAEKVCQMQNVPEDVKFSAKGEYRDLHYRTACCYYILEEYGMALVFLNSIEFADFETILLRGLCEYELAQDENAWNGVSDLLTSVEANLLSHELENSTAFHQQVILTKGFICLSHIYYFGIGTSKDLKRAYEIISLAYNMIPNENLKELIAGEWKRYR